MSTDRLIVTDGDVDTAVVAEYERSRREMVRKGLAFGGAVLAAGSIPGLLATRNAFAQADDDEQIAAEAVGLEQVLVEAYDRSTGQLSGFARLFRNQEREHERVLTTALRLMGGRPGEAPLDRLQGLGGDLRGRATFLIELENAAVAAYLDAHEQLKDAALMKTMSSILGNEAQHLVVLRDLAGQQPVPKAFENGQE